MSDRPLPRWNLAIASLIHAAVLGWAAVVLPWRSFTAFAVLTSVCAAAHAAVAVLAALRHRLLAPVWRAQSVLSIAYLLYVGWGLLSSAWAIRSVYAGLGSGMAAALTAGITPVVLLTLPIACWGIAATGGLRLGRRGQAAALALPIAAGARLGWLGHDAAGDAIADEAAIATFEAELESLDLRDLPAPNPRGTLSDAGRADCDAPPSRGTLTLLVALERPEGSGRAACLQATTPAELARALRDRLVRDAARVPVKLDLVVRVAELPPDAEPVASLAVRPGLDGLCALEGGGARCLAPWQLVTRDAFVANAPIAAVPDARLGIALAGARHMLGDARGPLVRAATRGWVLAPGKPLRRTGRAPSSDVELSAETVKRASSLAAAYIRDAQQRDGRFSYILDPFSGREVSGDFSIARQAGTTLALCELGSGKATTKVVARSLDLLAGLARPVAGGERAVVSWPKGGQAPDERIGPAALTLASILRCRPLAGDVHDAVAGRLTRTLLSLQRADGGFHHRLTVATGEPVSQPGSIYTDGQIVLALVLAEQLAASGSGALPPAAEIGAAVDRAMRYFADFWPSFARDLVFLEENWHCIAAAAALPGRRHDGYERFCLDYVAFKSRLVLDAGSGVDRELVGGYAFGNLVPPHNTATAGFGEALAAAIAVARARGLDTTEHEARMRAVLGFLLRAQWLPETCWPCSRRVRVAGGFGEHMASPKIRIDYVQHAWAAIGHGGAALGLHGEPAN
jgi:hypothetical protein